MLLLGTTDKIQLVTSSTSAIDVSAHFVDSGSPPAPVNPQVTAISSATTTDIIAAPSSGQRNVQTITARNKGAAANTVTVVIDRSSTDYELFKATLGPNDVLQFLDGVGFFVYPNRTLGLFNAATADQALGTAETYIAGSALPIPSNRPITVGASVTWDLCIVKTAASTAAANFLIKFGTNGTTADSTRVTLTMGAQTAAADTGYFEIKATFRGPIGASCIVQGLLAVQHHTGTTTGFVNLATPVYQAVSAGFDCTVANSIVGLSSTPGASAAWTVKNCIAGLLLP